MWESGSGWQVALESSSRAPGGSTQRSHPLSVTSHGPVLYAGPEKEGPPRKKAGLASFRLLGLKSRDQGGCTPRAGTPCHPGNLAVGKGSPSTVPRQAGARAQMWSSGSLAVWTERSWWPSWKRCWS